MTESEKIKAQVMKAFDNPNAPAFVHSSEEYEKKDSALVVFYGFNNGKLSNKYSVVQNKTRSELQVILEIEKLSGAIFSKIEFDTNIFPNVTFNLEEIDINTAIALMLSGENNTLIPAYEAPETPDFDENCNENCRPGDHHCGKELND